MTSEHQPLRVTIVDGVGLDASTYDSLRSNLEAHGATVHAVHDLLQEKLAPCQGCWQCWVGEPGVCKSNDAGNEIMKDAIAADILLWTTKVKFGCWSSRTKSAIDRSIGLISPFFRRLHGETHHRKRYQSYPSWAVLAFDEDGVRAEDSELFRTLVARNALNLSAEGVWVGFATDERTDDVGAMMGAAVEELRTRRDIFVSVDPPAQRPERVGVPTLERPRHVVQWVGSAKPRGRSTSESLGGHLLERLEARGWTTETIHVAGTVGLNKSIKAGLVETLRKADLVVLSTPVYVDCLPALVLRGLSQLVDADLGASPPALLPIVQCGFPELTHTTLAVEVAARAAEAIGMAWVGHLVLGSGGMIDGVPLAELGGRVHAQVESLDAVAQRLDEGGTIDEELAERFTHVVMGPRLYTLAGQAGWLASAWSKGSVMKMWQRPFEERGSD